MNAIYKKGMCLLTAVMAFVLLTACSSDNDSYDVPGAGNITRDMIVGEWYSRAAAGDYIISCYKADGSLSDMHLVASKKEWSFETWYGYWDFSDGKLTTVTDVNHIGLMSYNTKGVSKIIHLSKYQLGSSSLDDALVSGDIRIIDTYQMTVGEKRQAIVNDSEFIPQEYSSDSYHIASVDNEGTIEARHLGTTYILIKSSIGTAVIRVVVNDSMNVFNDILQSMGLPVQAITKEYGDQYLESTLESGMTVRHYYLPDEKVKDIRLQIDTDGYVEVVEQMFSPYITADEVREALNRKYDFLISDVYEGGPYDLYTTFWQCRRVFIYYLENLHQILINFQYGVNNLKKYDNYFKDVVAVNYPLWAIAYILDYTMTNEDQTNRSFKTSLPYYPFKYVEVFADEQSFVNRVKLYFDDKITFQDVEYYIKRFYLPTSSPNQYTNLENTYYLGIVEGEDGYLKYFQYDKKTAE